MSHNIPVKNIFCAKKELDQAFGVFTYITQRLSKKKHNVDQCFAEERNLCSTKEVESYCEVFTEYMETHQQYCRRHEEFIKAINNYNEEREKMEWDSIDLSGFGDSLFPVSCTNSSDQAFDTKTNGNGNSEKRDEDTGQITNDRHNMSIGSDGRNKKLIRMNTENTKDSGQGVNKNDTKTKSSLPHTELNGDVDFNENSDEENEPIELPRSMGNKKHCGKHAYICRTQQENDNTDEREHCASSQETRKRNIAPKSSVEKRKHCNETTADANYKKDDNESNATKQQEKKSRLENGDKTTATSPIRHGKKSDVSVNSGERSGSELTGNQQEKRSIQNLGTKSSPIGISDSSDEDYGSKPNIISPRSCHGKNWEEATCSQSTRTTRNGECSWKKSYHSHSLETVDESSDEDFTRKPREKTSKMCFGRAMRRTAYMNRTETVNETSGEGNNDEQKETTSTPKPKRDLRPSSRSQRSQEMMGIIDEEHDADNESFAEGENSDDDNNNKPKEKMSTTSTERNLRMSTRVQRNSHADESFIPNESFIPKEKTQKHELRRSSRKKYPEAEIHEKPNERINFGTNRNQCRNETVSKRSKSISLAHSYGRPRERLNMRLYEKFGIKIGKEFIGLDRRNKKISHLLLTRKTDNLVENKDDVLTFRVPDGKDNFRNGMLLSQSEKAIPIFYDTCYRGDFIYYVGHWQILRNSSKIHSPPEVVDGKSRCMSIDFIYEDFDWELERAIKF